jgi:hypothetical protein
MIGKKEIQLMPVTLPPLSRRRFVFGTVAAGAAAFLQRPLRAADPVVDPHRFALLSDIHIDQNRRFFKEETYPWDNLQQVIAEVLALNPLPAAVLVNGDLACHGGTREDYATLIEGLAPLRKAGMTIHLSMGNHDARRNFFAALPPDPARQKQLPERQVCLISTPRANFFMLDSLQVTAKTPGSLGAGQLAWLAKALDTQKDKPAIVMVHHDPLPDQAPEKTEKSPNAEKAGPSGLLDTKAFYDVIMPRKQVKAYVYGHTHDWQYSKREDLHLVNLPPTAWLFKAGRPKGWVDLNLREDGATFELRSLDVKHPQHGEKVEAKWRVM